MANKELEVLFENEHHDLKPWIIGKIPKHFKRLSVSDEEALRLAKLGAVAMASAFGIKLFFCQAVIVGAILDSKYDEVVVISPSQYGKSFILGRAALLRAYRGAKQYIAGAAANVTQIIMSHTVASTQEASKEIKDALLNKSNELERLATSLSKQRIAFSTGGFVEAITLGDTYNDNLIQNKAVGRGGDYIVDEAAQVSDDTFAEMGRREFARIDGKKYKSILISNPHRPGVFYDKMTQPNPPEGTLILWMDALTAVEEERFTKEMVLNSEFARHKSTLRRYLLCVLDVDGGGMFETPKVHEKPIQGEYTQYFMGIDSAYKGKDSVTVALGAVDSKGCRVEEIYEDNRRGAEWIEGVTSEDIIKKIVRIDRNFHVANTCVDTGYGVWLNEGLIQHGVNSHGVNFSEAPTKSRVKKNHYSAKNALNKRAEMYIDLQDLIENDRISFSRQAYEKIRDALPYITAERKSNGKIKIVDKEAVKAVIGKSPDALDSVVLLVHAMIQFLGDSEMPIT